MAPKARITVPLEYAERSALMHLARAELREPRDQARHLLREALIERGFLRAAESVVTNHRGVDSETED